jgi:hypothetical protein
MRRFITLLLAAGLVALAGCTGDPTKGDVRGTVTLDGVPLKEGAIRFSPIDGKSATAGGVIANGTCATTVPVGKHRVEITAIKFPEGVDIGRNSNAEYTVAQLIPAKYNTSSELTIDVQPGLNEPKFELKSR